MATSGRTQTRKSSLPTQPPASAIMKFMEHPQQTAPSPRTKWIDVAKGIGIILVCFGHIRNGDGQSVWLPALDGLVAAIYLFHMPFFSLLGGFTFSAERPFKEFVIRKAKTLLIPYYVFSLYFIAKPIALLILPSLAATFETNHDYSIVPQLYDVLINGNGLWFLWAYFIGEICTYGIVRIISSRKYDAIIGILLILLSIAITHFFPAFVLPFRIIRGIEVCGFILLGSAMKAMLVTLNKRASVTLTSIFFVLFFITAFFSITSGLSDDSPLLLLLNISAMFIGTFFALFLSISISANRILEYIGRASIVFYSLNALSLNVAKVGVFRILKLNAKAAPFITQFLVGILLVIISLLILWIANIIIQRWLWWSIGKSNPRKALPAKHATASA